MNVIYRLFPGKWQPWPQMTQLQCSHQSPTVPSRQHVNQRPTMATTFKNARVYQRHPPQKLILCLCYRIVFHLMVIGVQGMLLLVWNVRCIEMDVVEFNLWTWHQ
jgi:hypothetical protein